MDKIKLALMQSKIDFIQNFDVVEISTIKFSQIIDLAIFPKNTKDLIQALKILYKIRKTVAPLTRAKRNQQMQKVLEGVEFSVFSNNCLGGVFCHDAGQPFRSPTVNMSFDGYDFMRFLERPQYYLSKEIEFFIF